MSIAQVFHHARGCGSIRVCIERLLLIRAQFGQAKRLVAPASELNKYCPIGCRDGAN